MSSDRPRPRLSGSGRPRFPFMSTQTSDCLATAETAGPRWTGKRALLATMHGKERVIAPLAARFLGLQVSVPEGLDTDRFGSFSREVPRDGSPLQAARAKISAGFEQDPDARFGLASEGSFGPHPTLPFLPLGHEIVVLQNRDTGLELIGEHRGSRTPFAHVLAVDVEGGRDFAARVGFPGQGLIVTAYRDDRPAPELALYKTISDRAALDEAIKRVLDVSGTAFVETDMRAHRNPRRMQAIRRAMLDLVRKTYSLCLPCGQPGYAVTERLPGLPCADCWEPTLNTRAWRWSCAACGFAEDQPVSAETADPGGCGDCNP